MDKRAFMERLEDAVRACRTNDVTTEAEDGALEAAKRMLEPLPEQAFETQAEPQRKPKRYEPEDAPEDDLELFAVEVEWDYLKTIGVRARSEQEARDIADELDGLGIINPDPSCRIEGEEAKIVDAAEIYDGCPVFSQKDCKEPEPEPRTEIDRFTDRLLERDLLDECSRIAGARLTWHSVREIWERYEKVLVASELAFRLVECNEDYYPCYALIGRDVCIGRVSAVKWFERVFAAYWDKPQFGEDFDEAAVEAWRESQPSEPSDGAQGGPQLES